MKSPLFQYDKASYDLIHSLYDECIFGSPEEVFSINAKRHRGKVVMPFIGIYRLPDFSINMEYFNDPMLRNGVISRTTYVRGRGIEYPNQKTAFHALPVTLQYQLDVYATKRDVCDGITAELMMYLKENPYVTVPVLDAGNRTVQFNFDLDDSVMDNTDISSFDELGRFYRLTLTANITSALIFRVDDYSKVEKVYLNFGVTDSLEDGKVDLDEVDDTMMETLTANVEPTSGNVTSIDGSKT